MNEITLFLLVILITYSYSYLSNKNRFIYKSRNIKLYLGSETETGGSYPSTLVYPDDVSLGKAVCHDLLSIASSSITEKGKAFVAVPGGSVLKMLSGLKSNKNDIDWNKVYWFYVNHKCVSSDDETSTNNKALKYFMKELYKESNLANNVVSIDIDDAVVGHDTIAHKYEKRIKELLPALNKLPIFDYMLLGMGADGHIGSLYPNRKEVTLSNPSWVLTVDKKKPPSITLSLPVMNAARVVLAGEDKAEAAYFGIGHVKSPSEFPAAGIISNAIWMIDSKASSRLKSHKIPFKNM